MHDKFLGKKRKIGNSRYFSNEQLYVKTDNGFGISRSSSIKIHKNTPGFNRCPKSVSSVRDPLCILLRAPLLQKYGKFQFFIGYQLNIVITLKQFSNSILTELDLLIPNPLSVFTYNKLYEKSGISYFCAFSVKCVHFCHSCVSKTSVHQKVLLKSYIILF